MKKGDWTKFYLASRVQLLVERNSDDYCDWGDRRVRVLRIQLLIILFSLANSDFQPPWETTNGHLVVQTSPLQDPSKADLRACVASNWPMTTLGLRGDCFRFGYQRNLHRWGQIRFRSTDWKCVDLLCFFRKQNIATFLSLEIGIRWESCLHCYCKYLGRIRIDHHAGLESTKDEYSNPHHRIPHLCSVSNGISMRDRPQRTRHIVHALNLLHINSLVSQVFASKNDERRNEENSILVFWVATDSAR